MDQQRFEALADAYGGRILRWPAAEQDAAFAWLADASGAAEPILAQALMLDEALDGLAAPAVSADLRARVLAGAPAVATPRRARPGLSGWRRWAAGAGVGAALAAASAAGVVIGVQISAQARPAASEDGLLAAVGEEDWIVLPEAESQS